MSYLKITIEYNNIHRPDTDKPVERIDLILGGSPCYNLSMIGRREGLSTKENIEVLSLEQYLDLKNKELNL